MTDKHIPLTYEFGALYSKVASRVILADRQNPETTPVERDDMLKKIALAYNLHNELKDALWFIVTFCEEHPEWFGEGTPDDGAEFEWLEHAKTLLAKLPKE